MFYKNKRLALSRVKDDTASMAEAFGFNADQTNTDSALYYINEAMQLLVDMQSQNKTGQWQDYIGNVMWASSIKSSILYSLGDYPRALELHFRVLQMAQENKDSLSIVWTMINIADDYRSMKDYSHSLDYCRKAQVFYSSIKRTSDPMFAKFDMMLFGTLAHNYNDLNVPTPHFIMPGECCTQQ
jgi:tetratricopeptide (TPR) repeat protein